MTTTNQTGKNLPQGITQLVLLRHGQSVWNRDKIFTGWSDVALSPKGQKEAEQAAYLLKQAGFTFDLCFCSTLQRAKTTPQNRSVCHATGSDTGSRKLASE